MTTSDKIRVLVAEDSEIEFVGYRELLEPSGRFEVIDIIQVAQQIPEKVRELQPQLLITDLMFGLDRTAGIRMIRVVHQEFPNVKVIAISAYDDLLPLAITAGADGVLTRREKLQDMFKLMEAVMTSTIPTHQEVSGDEILLQRAELEVLQFLAQGLSNKEIALKRRVGDETIKTQVKAILWKLRVNSRGKAVEKARQLGILV